MLEPSDPCSDGDIDAITGEVSVVCRWFHKRASDYVVHSNPRELQTKKNGEDNEHIVLTAFARRVWTTPQEVGTPRSAASVVFVLRASRDLR